MIIEDEGAGSASVFDYMFTRNLLLDESGFDMMPEWICLETWSTGSDAKERNRRRRRPPERHRRRS